MKVDLLMNLFKTPNQIDAYIHTAKSVGDRTREDNAMPYHFSSTDGDSYSN